MTTEEFLAEILMVICFVPVMVYLLLMGWEHVRATIMRRYKQDCIFRRIERESPGYRDNYRVLR